MLLLGAVSLGLAGAALWTWWSHPVASGTSSAIEWNAVQAVPTRAPDTEDVEWQERAAQLHAPVMASAQGTGRSRQAASIDGSSGAAGARIYVIDGDTFGIGSRRIRIANIDAPETHPPRCLDEARLGLAATDKLKALLSRGTVTMSGVGHDRYGRELAWVQVNGQDVGEAMIGARLARSYGGGKRQGWC